MKTSGEILKKKRKQLGLNIEQVANNLKIQEKYIDALEKNDYSLFDSKVIARGFLLKYARFLGLETDKVLAFWRRDFNIPVAVNPPGITKFKKFYITPKFLISILIIFVISLFSFLALIQYRLINTPPKIVIIAPKDGDKVNDSLVYLKGVTDPGVELFLNNNIVNTDENGEFAENINLSQGINKINLKAVNEYGIENSKTITLLNDSKHTNDSKAINELLIKNEGSKPLYIEIKNSNKVIFNGFILENASRTFEGENLSIYTDSAENMSILFNNEKVDLLKEEKIGAFYKEFK